MKHLLLAFFVVFSANLFTACSSNGDSNIPEIGEHSAEFKIFMEKKKTGFPSVKDPRFGLIPAPLDNSNLLKQFISSSNKATVKNATDPAYDLRDYGRVTSVKDQGGCGSCWSFASMASLESYFLSGETNDFSENNLKNLHGFELGHCDGGNADMAAAYFMRWNGPVYEASDPYSETSDISPTLSPVKHVTDHYVVSSSSISSIKEAVVGLGVVTTEMYYDDAYMNFATGAYYYSGANTINHGVAIVGWDDNYSKSNFKTSPVNDGAWIIKNSWGTGWGNSGYFYVSYENTDINDNCHAFKATDVEYENLYSYDYFGRTGYGGYGLETAWIANAFTAGGDETLKAVSFYANAHSTAYEIRIYTGVTTDPTTGATLQTTQTGTAAISGYNSVVLDSPVDISSGTKFSVVIKVTTPGSTDAIPFEMPYGGYANATASTGQSFMTYDSGGNPASWTDVAGWNADTNVNVKAYTVNQIETIALVINEIDYDQSGIDDAEFIEIYNHGDSSVNLSGMSLVLINGSTDLTYLTINMPDVDLAAGDYFVVCGDASKVANCDLDTTPDTDLIQNGSPDAVALYNGTTLIDTVSYEGNTTGFTETAGAGYDDPNLASIGLSRYPDGTDTDDNSTDFSVRCITPGAANSSNASGCLCGNGSLDAGEDCELDDGPCCSDTCEFKASTVECRVAVGACDAAEHCSGTSAVCPTDNVEPVTTECRASAGDCDVAEYCDGSGKDCPADVKSTAECRASAGICDAAEICDGVSNDCPADSKLTTECRVSTGVCDVAEVCDGVGNDCPEDVVAATDIECRGQAGICDAAEFCNGTNKTCPADVKKTTQCRVSAGICDVAEVCDGVHNDCPADVKKTTICRGQSAFCDEAEFCDGVNNDCPEDKVKPDTLKCRSSAGICDAAEYCDGTSKTCPDDSKLTTQCRASSGACDVAEMCDGINNDCPEDVVAATDIECRGQAGVCDAAEFCNGTNKTCPADVKKTTECRASAGICDVAEVCDGVNNECPEDIKKTTVCRGQSAFCDEAEFCDGVNNDCPDDRVKPDTLKCRSSAGICDAAEYCDGTNKTCPEDMKLTTECREKDGGCDVAEFCNGIDNDCPEDGFASSDTVCSIAPGVCGEDATCNGVAGECPSNLYKNSDYKCAAAAELCENDSFCTGSSYECPETTAKADTVECRSSAGDCDAAEFCDGTAKICPEDLKLTTECRGAAGVCDVAEICDGVNNDCPSDLKLATECRAKDGECDVAEVCNGTDNDCPVDDMVADGESCIGDGYPWTEYKCYSGVCEAGEELYGSCVAPNEISVFPYSDTQDTTGRPDHVVTYGTDCDALKSSGTDVVYELHVKTGFTYTITLNSTEDMAFVLLNACGDNEACIEAVDAGESGEETVEFVPEADAVYALIVETAGSTGEYTLTVTETVVEIPDETEDMDSVNDQETVDEDEIVDEVEDSDDAEVVDLVDEEDPVDNDAEVVDGTEDIDAAEVDDETADKADDAEINDQSELSDESEVSDEMSDNSDAAPLNDEDGDYNLEGDGCSCSLII